MNSTFFAKPPEIHRVGENYRLFVYPASEAPVIVTFARVKSAAEELHVYVTGATSGARPSPWIFDLDIPRRFRGHDLTRRILWLDPDGSVHPLPVNADEQVFAPMETR
jgi:hypothetical protein